MLSIAGTFFLLSTNASHLGTAFVTLKPFADRKGRREEYGTRRCRRQAQPLVR